MTARHSPTAPPPRRLYPPLKRALDVVASALGLALLAPVLLACAAAVRWRLGSPVLFRQTRPGRGGVPFEILKFRTMREIRDAGGELLPDRERLTPLGRFLRRTALDELPELVNVLRGEMSLVGPRPLLLEYLERFDARQARRLEVRPGITGLAQVKGRNALLFSERLAYDVEYVERMSLALDLKILALTVVRLAGGALEDRAGQSVTVVDDLGLHPETRSARRVRRRTGDG